MFGLYWTGLSVDVFCAILDCALGISPVPSFSGVQTTGPVWMRTLHVDCRDPDGVTQLQPHMGHGMLSQM